MKRNRKARPLADRFWEKVDRQEGCWLWLGAVSSSGYGSFGLGRRGEGYDRAHRVSWRLLFGEIPEGLFVCHTCDNRRCVRPDHLFLGTHAANMRDMTSKGRAVGNVRVGDNHGTTKIPDAAIPSIRARRAAGTPLLVLAEEFGVTRSQICAIARGRARATP